MKAIEEQTILITGATDGLGKQTAWELAKQGATVLLHGRSREKTAATIKEISTATGNDKLEYYLADLASLDEVRRLAQDIGDRYNCLDILINNAGIGAGERNQAKRELSQDGYELRFAVNYLAPFLLTHLILPLLQNSTPARIINVASVGQSAIAFDDVMLEKNYDGLRAYSQSKLALVMFTFDLAEKLKQEKITVNCLHPASLMNTKMVYETFGSSMNTVEKGTDALLYLVSSDLDEVTGEYFDGKQKARALAQAYDTKARQQLWNLSEKLTELQMEKIK
jgi:NAD(P)-dependent dehydrogenase (short-subunit alcohol dehydrogenase family)